MSDAIFPGGLEQFRIEASLLPLSANPSGPERATSSISGPQVRSQRGQVRLAFGPQCFKDRLLKERQLAIKSQEIGCGGIPGGKLSGTLDARVKTPLHSLGAGWPGHAQVPQAMMRPGPSSRDQPGGDGFHAVRNKEHAHVNVDNESADGEQRGALVNQDHQPPHPGGLSRHILRNPHEQTGQQQQERAIEHQPVEKLLSGIEALRQTEARSSRLVT